MNAYTTKESPPFQPVTITITFETLRELDDFIKVCKTPFCDLGYDCLYDVIQELEEHRA